MEKNEEKKKKAPEEETLDELKGGRPTYMIRIFPS